MTPDRDQTSDPAPDFDPDCPTSGPGRSLSRRSALRGLGAAAAIPLAGSKLTGSTGPPPSAGSGASGVSGASDASEASSASAESVRQSVEGKVALVTGSTRNLGRATVLELARRGADVVVNGRSSRDEAEEVVREAEALGVRAVAIMADVGVEEEVNRLVDEALDALGRIDVLINNAGARGTASITEMTTEQWRQAMAVNADGPFFCTRAVVPSMIENGGGRIITVSGLNSYHGRPEWAHICGSKMAAVGMTRALAAELAPYGILVNHVVPGAFTFHANPEEAIPLGRLGLEEELANTYAFLASDDASYITGQTFHVNGGELRY